MADEITLEQLQAKQVALMTLAEQLQKQADGNAIAALAPRLQREAEELARMAKQFEAQQLEKTGGGMRGSTEVVLTAAQRERILAATGIKLESVRIRDEAGIVARTMPATDPRIIEYRALKEAERLKIEQEARALLRVQLERLLADLESKSPALAGKVAELRADPNYADGVLHTKT